MARRPATTVPRTARPAGCSKGKHAVPLWHAAVETQRARGGLAIHGRRGCTLGPSSASLAGGWGPLSLIVARRFLASALACLRGGRARCSVRDPSRMEGSAKGRVDASRTAALPANGRPNDRGNAVTAEDGFKGRRRALTVDSRCAVVLYSDAVPCRLLCTGPRSEQQRSWWTSGAGTRASRLLIFIVDQSGEATHGSARHDTHCPSLLDPPRARFFPQVARKRSLKTGASS